MDAAGLTRGAPLIRRTLLIFLCLLWHGPVFGQSFPADSSQNIVSPVEQVKQLFTAERWQDLVNLAITLPSPSADIDFYYGSSLARLGRWDDARRIFLAGHRLDRRDERFLVELAGVSFKQQRYGEAARELQTALRIWPRDEYANDFLGTVYFLQGNLAAALKYWNRVKKPRIEEVRYDPVPRIDAALLDRAFAFSPASTLQLPELLTTEDRIRGMEIFPSTQLNLQARDDGNFDVVFRNTELDGWGPGKWGATFLLLRGLPAETLYPEFYNFRRRDLNFTSMFRWDANKLRVQAAFSGPLKGKPARHFSLALDLRDENWNLYRSFTGVTPLLGAFNLRREAVSANVTSFVSGRWTWSAGAEASHRDFRDVDLGTVLVPVLLPKGYQLKQTTSVDVSILQVPEHRLTVTAGASSQLGRIWSEPTHSFEKLQPWLRLHWLPQTKGDDYELLEQIRAGKMWGSVPFDELFTLGIAADNDLWMRGHIATRDGRKGSAPLGRNYFLSNWEQDKNIYSNGLITLKLGPFVDIGKITDSLPGLGSQQWLWDVGAQAKVKVLGTEIVFSYGKDLQSGNNAFYITLH